MTSNNGNSNGNNNWNKKEWIKDVLSKSGTDLVEIKDENIKDRKMVYYPSLPLIIKSEQQERQQLCTQLNGETQIYHLQPVQAIQPQQLSPTSNHQNVLSSSPSPPQLHLMQSTKNPLNRSPSSITSTATVFIPTNQNYIQNVKIEQIKSGINQQRQINEPTSSSNPIINNKRGPKPGSRQTITPIKPQFQCDQCNMIFGSKSAHTSHVKSHKKDNNYSTNNNNLSQPTTSVIGNGINNQMQLNVISQVSSTGSDPYQCNVCQKTFAVPARLIRHYRTHTGERPFECEFCHKMFSVKENLQVHRRIHTKERPYKCEVCGRAFEHSGKLHRHMRIHTGERPHKCSVCNKTFIQSGQLVIHMRTHTGEKPYKCPVEGCGKGFTCSKQLKVHSRTHTGEKPYHCDICFRDFGYNHVLKLHKVQHYGSKCYKCTICDETFKNKKEMEAHIKGHANELPDDDDDDDLISNATTTESSENQIPISSILQNNINNNNNNINDNNNNDSDNNNSTNNNINNNNNIKQETLNGFQLNSNRIESNLQLETDKIRDNISINPNHQIPPSINQAQLQSQQQQQQHILSSLNNTNVAINNSQMDIDQSNSSSQIYDNVYQRFEQAASFTQINNNNINTNNIISNNNVNNNQQQHPTINPALLAAASIASRRIEESAAANRNRMPSPPPASLSNESGENSNEESNNNDLHEYYRRNGRNNIRVETDRQQIERYSPVPPHYAFESLDVLRQSGYFAPAPVAEFKPSLHHNEIVRQVEAAIAGAGLSPPRSSSTESPERSSSPESDTMMMADRDVMTLPLRKRKLYMNENQNSKDNGNSSQTVRMNSVIQFAKAS